MLAFIIIALTNSCGGGIKEQTSNEIELTPKSINVSGALGDYIAIVEGKYKLTISEYSQELKVQFKRTDKQFDFDAPYLAELGYFKVEASCLDESGAPATGYENAGSGDNEKKLVGLKTGETAWVTFTFSAGKENVPDKLKKFEINTEAKLAMNEMKTVKGAELGSSSSSNSKSVSSMSSGDCDKFIKDYEAFANSYIKILKKYKANPSDASILTEYADAAQKAAEMQKGANDCSDAKYASKLMEIANKIAKAAM